MKTVRHDGRTTTYRFTEGTCPTVVFVHGSGSNGENWRYQLSELPYAMAAPDLSGHGESDDVETAAGQGTLAAYTADVLAVARAEDADVLVRNSLGGAVVLHAVLERKFEPEALVLAGAAAKLGVHPELLDTLRSDFEAYTRDDSGAVFDADDRLLDQSTGRNGRPDK